jgi:F0F1-type ATP synthase alpha subunit
VDAIPVAQIKRFMNGLADFMENTMGWLLEKIEQRKILDDDLKAEIRAGVAAFKERFTAEGDEPARVPLAAAEPVAAAR